MIGVSDRTMRHWREPLEDDGYDGLADRLKGMVSAKRVPLETCERAREYRLAEHGRSAFKLEGNKTAGSKQCRTFRRKAGE